MYKDRIRDKNRAIKEIQIYETFDQIMFVSQNAINSSLVFKESLEVGL